MKVNKQYCPVVLIITLYKLGGSNFWTCEWNPKAHQSTGITLGQTKDSSYKRQAL